MVISWQPWGDATLALLWPFTWIDVAAFSSATGDLRWELVGGDLKLLADRYGDGIADLEVTQAANSSVTAAVLAL